MTTASALRHAFSIGTLTLLAACTVGPNYRLPDNAAINASAANGTFLASEDDALAKADVPEHWWRLYDDQALDTFIAAALTANTDLRVASASLARSHALLEEARTGREPTIPVEAGIERSQAAGEQYLLRRKLPRSTDYETSVSVGYDLDLFGAIRRGIEAATADYESVAAAHEVAQINVVAETARAYANICGLGLELATARHSLELQERGLELTQELQRAGRAIDLDVTRSRQLVEQIKSTLPALEGGQRNALYRLATLTGQPPAAFDQAVTSCATPPRLSQPLPVGDGASLLKRRPDVRRAERQLAAATAEIGLVTAQLYPDVQLGLSLGSLGATSDFLTAPTNFWNIGSILKWQANQSATRARIAAANATAQLALANFDGVVLESLREAETALNTYVHDLRREDRLRAARNEAAKAAEDAQRLQDGGRATALIVIDARRTLVSAEQSVAQIQTEIANDQIAAFLALGGGWYDPLAGATVTKE